MPDRSLLFEQLHELELALQPVISLERQVDWIAQCSNLTSLRWSAGDGPSAVLEDFILYLAKGAWPNLCELTLNGFNTTEAQTTQLIEGMQQVIVFKVFSCDFGLLSLVALGSHFLGLEKLDINNSRTTTGSIVPEILASCPQLESLSVGRVKSQYIVHGQPWACVRSMKTLRICVILPQSCEDANHHQRDVLKRMSQLINLNYLDLTDACKPRSHVKYLDLRLKKGLGQLASLKLLMCLVVSSSHQRLEAKDVEWMTKSWRRLKAVHGSLNPDKNIELNAMLSASGIHYIVKTT
ncbi:hypothetical protein BGZ65_002472 [Modicella reniformis]|uniref:Uncharacterized protein n=1 Tax=Modicella reniformis TaxID=1440133 RepID=A0A9P6IRK0_9FUNG|nr:hypothetical protein BGZ65_002472 [Modicella reniformis]